MGFDLPQNVMSMCLGILVTAWTAMRTFPSKKDCIAIRGDCNKVHDERGRSVDRRLVAIQETLLASNERHDERYGQIEDFMKRIHKDFYRPAIGGD